MHWCLRPESTFLTTYFKPWHWPKRLLWPLSFTIVHCRSLASPRFTRLAIWPICFLNDISYKLIGQIARLVKCGMTRDLQCTFNGNISGCGLKMRVEIKILTFTFNFCLDLLAKRPQLWCLYKQATPCLTGTGRGGGTPDQTKVESLVCALTVKLDPLI